MMNSLPTHSQALSPAPPTDDLAALKALVQTAEHTLLHVFHQNLAKLANIDDLTKITDNIARLAAIRKTIAQLAVLPVTDPSSSPSPGPVRSSGLNLNPDPSDSSNPSDPKDDSAAPALQRAHADLAIVTAATAELQHPAGEDDDPNDPPSPPPASGRPSPDLSAPRPISARATLRPLTPDAPLSQHSFRSSRHSVIRAGIRLRASNFEFASKKPIHSLPCPSVAQRSISITALRAIPRARLAATLNRVHGYIKNIQMTDLFERFRRTRDTRLARPLFELLFPKKLSDSAHLFPIGIPPIPCMRLISDPG